MPNMKSLEELSSPAERGERLRVLRNMSGLTIHELADKYDVGASTIKYWECAKSEGLSPKGAKKFIEAMANEGIYCSYMWLMHGVGIHPQYIDKRYGDTKKQQNPMNTSLEEERAIYREMDLFLKETDNSVTLAVYDDSMEPFYFLGDTVGGNRLFDKDIHKALDRDCLVETEDHQILCRRFTLGNEIDRYTLCCLNHRTTVYPPNMYNIKIVSVAPISRIWRRFGSSIKQPNV